MDAALNALSGTGGAAQPGGARSAAQDETRSSRLGRTTSTDLSPLAARTSGGAAAEVKRHGAAWTRTPTRAAARRWMPRSTRSAARAVPRNPAAHGAPPKMRLGRRDSVARRAPTSQQGSWVGNPVTTKPARHGLAVGAGSNGSAAAAQRCLSTTTAALGERSQPATAPKGPWAHHHRNRLRCRFRRRQRWSAAVRRPSAPASCARLLCAQTFPRRLAALESEAARCHLPSSSSCHCRRQASRGLLPFPPSVASFASSPPAESTNKAGEKGCGGRETTPTAAPTAAQTPALPLPTRPHPRRRFRFSPRWGFTCRRLRISLGLVDLSRTPSGTFFREVHPGSEMASQNDQNKAK